MATHETFSDVFFSFPNDPQDPERYEQATDVRTQLKFLEHLEQLEKQRKDNQEREILLKAAKVQMGGLMSDGSSFIDVMKSGSTNFYFWKRNGV